MKSEQFTTTILEAEEGHFLTQAKDVDIKDRIIASKIALGKYDSAENWKEISSEEAETYRGLIEAAQEKDINKDFQSKDK